ncbi:hypothetical protein Ga0123462_1541 [Mariprofundus ferrinatatus]|uniref:Aminoglycoside phosphotransferase domain-containing protein n=1 Tax=Mariprofundus ferrinatatus TaxID=1921087 RepID=A0A2K8LBX6_9PROT|nr:AAA family ATPase [Mariprofundus ferrinatatus]ATX82404.1 hypothetical protein Ga0123462_1541 [Mariprofundus ferrinatatus]
MEQLPDHIRPFFEPAIYPHPAAHIEMIQTHISWVILAGDYAYKFKKPVDFGFLDFTTLAKRKYFCERELELNRRISPEIYIDTVPVSEEHGNYSFGERGNIVDYCLKMRRFSQNDLLDQRLASDSFNAAWMDRLAADTAEFHAESEPNYDIDHIGLLRSHIETNLNSASRHLESGLNRQTIEVLMQFAEEELPPLQHLLEIRQRKGCIRHCHGDLHMKNITLIDDRPRLFDCIEFNDDFATIDTMNDVAFLIMDCDAHGRADLGMRFLSRYLEFSGDYDGLELLPLYLFYRASVRGKVACLLADELDGPQRQAQLDEAAKYFDLALQYTESRRGNLFAVAGLSGSGKSHLALIGCGIERAVIIRSDATRKRIAPLYPELELYSREMHILTYRAMFAAANTALDAGFPVILDATFIHPDSRRRLKALADTCDTPPYFYWLDIEPSLLRERIKARQQQTSDISDADLHVLALQLAEYRRPDEAWVHFLGSSNSWPQTPLLL